MMYDEVQPLATPFLMASLKLYGEWQTFKILPHGKGTMDERQTVIDIIRTISREDNRYSRWEMEKDRKSLER